ncbi:reverse transcriptase domain-containing protein [Tanacetum coccineum]
MFKQLHINISLADALILIPKYQKMLKSLLSNKEKLIELANTPLNENCSAVILKKLPEKLGDPGKFLIPCGFSELKCKALADLGASINLMPLSVWKKLGLPELISTQMTLELANRDICTPVGIARDVFVPVGKFTFPADFVIVDYESDPRVPLILGRPFLRTARALIDVHGEEMILRDGNERLTLNMRHDTSSYSTQPHQESINMIDVYNVSHEEYREDLFATNHLSGNPTSSLTSHTDLTSPEVNDDIFDPEGDIIENLLNLDKTKDLPPYHDNQLSGNPTPISEPVIKSSSSSPTLTSIEESDLIWEEFEAYLIYDDELFDLETVNDDTYDDPFDSKEEKIKESKLLIDELDPPKLLCFDNFVINVAFVSSESTSNTNDVSTPYGASTSSGYNSQRENSSSYTDELMYSFFANQSNGPHLDHEDLEQLDEFDLEEIDLKWQVAMISMRLKKFYKKTGRKLHFDAKEPVGFDKTKVECYNCHKKGHFARECRSKGNTDINQKTMEGDLENRRNLKLCNSGLDTEVKSCSKECVESYDKLKKLYDEQREQLGDASIEIQAYTQALKNVEAQLVTHQKNQLWSSDTEDTPVNDKFANVEGMHVVPPPMTGVYMPLGPDKEIDESQFTYGPKQSQTSDPTYVIVISSLLVCVSNKIAVQKKNNNVFF